MEVSTDGPEVTLILNQFAFEASLKEVPRSAVSLGIPIGVPAEHDLQRIMWEDILLHLCRITDPPKSAGKDTLTIRRIADLIPDSELRERVNRQTEDARDKTQFARDWRNRRLAHRELPPIDGQQPRPLADASRRDVEAALAAIREVMNTIELHYLQSPVAYEYATGAVDSVQALLSVLTDGVAVRRS